MKKTFISIGISFGITLLSTLVVYLLLTNMDDIVNLLTKNENFVLVVKKIISNELTIPIELIILYFIGISVITYLLFNKKTFLIIALIILSLCFIISVSLLSCFDGNFVYTIINNLKESYEAFK